MIKCRIDRAQIAELELKSNPAKFWKYVKGERDNGNDPSGIRIGGCLESDPVTISECFGRFFESVFHDSSSIVRERPVVVGDRLGYASHVLCCD